MAYATSVRGFPTPVGFYAYLWLRPDGTPYYAGKGKDSRAFIHEGHRFAPPLHPNHIRIFLLPTEAAAFAFERMLIQLFGRKDVGTGCLRNFTDGGEGTSGCIQTPEHRRKNSEAQKGNRRHLGFIHSTETRAKMSRAAQGRKKSQDHRANIGKANHEFWTRDENRQRRSDAAKRQWSNPEIKAKMVEIRRARKAVQSCLAA